MKAMQLMRQGRSLKLRDIERPVPGQGEVLVRLLSCGVCHTDLHIRNGDEELPNTSMPITLGHEGVGIVEELGPGGDLGFKQGDRVGVPWLHDTCQSCSDCLSGEESVCVDQRAHGLQVDGAYAEYVLASASFLVSIPDKIDDLEAAPLLCAGATAYSAVKQAKLTPGVNCVIFGCGGLGLYAIQFAKLYGANVIAVDVEQSQLDVARSVGADQLLRSGERAVGEILKAGGGDVCINFAPTTAIWPMVEKTLNNHGKFISVAMPKGSVEMSLSWLTLIKPTITGTAVGSRQELREALELAASNNISVPIETIELEEVDSALDRLAGLGKDRVKGRIVVKF